MHFPRHWSSQVGSSRWLVLAAPTDILLPTCRQWIVFPLSSGLFFFAMIPPVHDLQECPQHSLQTRNLSAPTFLRNLLAFDNKISLPIFPAIRQNILLAFWSLLQLIISINHPSFVSAIVRLLSAFFSSFYIFIRRKDYSYHILQGAQYWVREPHYA